jgi:tetratricopeptide (TPR) repeat protein
VSGRFDAAADILAPVLPLCEGEWPIYFSRVASTLGAAYVELGRTQGGLELLRRADEKAAAIGFRYGHALVLSLLGSAYLSVGQTDQAQETAHRALETARRWGERGNEARARVLLGELCETSGEVEHARIEYEEALAIPRHGAMHQLTEKCLFNLTRLSG